MSAGHEGYEPGPSGEVTPLLGLAEYSSMGEQCFFTVYTTHHPLAIHQSTARDHVAEKFTALMIACWAGVLLALAGCATEEPSSVEDYRERYNKPLLSSGAQFAALPPAVQNTIRAQVGSSNIDDIKREESPGQVIYRIYFQNTLWIEPLIIASDGSVLDPDMIVAVGAPKEEHWAVTGSASSNHTLNDLPAAAVKAIQRRAPGAQVDAVIREVSGNQVVYIVTFKDGLHGPLRVTADGTITPESPR